MKVRKKEFFDAEQWFPGKEVQGVQGANQKRLCGCIFMGGPADIPHIHQSVESVTECWLVEPGDWIITDTKGNRCLAKPDIFDKIYEKTWTTTRCNNDSVVNIKQINPSDELGRLHTTKVHIGDILTWSYYAIYQKVTNKIGETNTWQQIDRGYVNVELT